MNVTPVLSSQAPRYLRFALGLVSAFALWAEATAANISLNASDAAGSSSFAAGTNWVGGAAPAAGNAYTVGTGLRLRTSTDDLSYTFAGASLTIANGFSTGSMNTASSNDLFGFTYKGGGAAGVYTVNNLILAGGSINHLNGTTQVFRIAGNLAVTAPSIIRAKQGPIEIRSVISGSSDLYIGDTDGGGATRAVTFSGTNTFTGNIITTAGVNSVFILADTGTLKFAPGATGVNNKISGPGTATFNGKFALDLTNASKVIGDSWTLVDAGALVETYGSTFSIPGFTKSNELWTGSQSGTYYQFSQTTGVLTVIPQPATFPAPSVTSAPRSNTVVVGSNLTLSVTATGLGNLTYAWSKDGVAIPSATSSTLPLTNLQTTDSATYSVTVSDDAAVSTGQPATTAVASASITVIAAADATVAYYRFEDGADAAALTSGTDSTANVNTLTSTGSLTYAAAVPYTKVPSTTANNTLSASFPSTGTAYGLSASPSGSLAGTVFTSFTVEAFVRFSAIGGFQTIVGRDDTGNPGEGVGAQSLFYLQKNNGNVFRVQIVDKSNVNLDVAGSAAAATAVVDTWYHVAAVGDAGAGTLTLYVNGVQAGSVTGFTGLFVPSSSSDTPWTLGRGDYAFADVDFLHGNLDEVRFSRVALAPTQFLNSNGTSFFVNPKITQAPVNQTVRVGGNASFTVAATGGTLTYQWYKNSVALPGETNATLNLTGVTTAADATYSVTVTDPAGASIGVTLATSASAVLRVLDVPAASRAISLNFVGAASAEGSWSSALGTLLAADSVGVVPVSNWNNSATVNSVATQTVPLALAENTAASTYATAVWTSANTWAARAADPLAKAPDTRLFHGYIESRANTGSTVTISGIPYGSYDVYVYVAGGAAGTIGKTSIDRVGSPTYYYRVISNDGFVVSATNPLAYMIGTSTDATAAATAPAASFVRFAAVTGSDLTITAADNTLNSNAGGIAAIEIVDRTPAGSAYPPSVTSSPVSQLKAGGSSVTLSVSALSNNAGGVLSYQWQKDGANLSGKTSPTLALTGLVGTDTGSYGVVITDTSSLGTVSTTRTASVVVVDSTRPLLINGDINAAGSSTFVGNGILRSTGPATDDLGGGTTVWNGLLGAAGTATRAVTKDSAGLTIPGVTFTYAGADGVEDNTTQGFIASSSTVALTRDYLYTDNQTTPLTGSIGGLSAFAGQRVTLVVYAYGKLSTAYSEALTSDASTVTLATASNHLGASPYVIGTTSSAGRDLTYNNLDATGGVSAAYATFSGVIASDGTVSWSVGPDSDAGRIPLVGFQLLISGEQLAPSVPTNLAAVAGDGHVSLTWTAVSGANTYTIKRSTVSGGPYDFTVSTGVVTTASYNDTTVVNGTTYYYVVAAAKTSPAVQSGYSNQASATPAASTTAVQSWRFTYFGTTANTGNAANTADPDGDGLNNLLEYALGTNPLTSSASPAVLGQSGGKLTLTFTPVVDASLSYTVEASNDLSASGGGWTTATAYGAFTAATPVTYTDLVLISANPRRFLRLKVTAAE